MPLLAAVLLMGCGSTEGRFRSPVRAIETDPGMGQSLVARVYAGVETGQEFTIEATESELQSLADAYMASPSVQDLVVWLEPDGAYAAGKVRALGWHTFSTRVRIGASQGRLQLEELVVDIDRRPLPRFVESSALKAANDALTDLHLSVSFAEVIHSEGAVQLAMEP